MLETLILFGATGDLAGRFLLPAIGALQAAGRLPEGFQILGAARDDWDDERFRRHVEPRLGEHAKDLPERARRTLLQALRYRRVDFTAPDSVAEVVAAAGAEPVAAYLALPASVFGVAVRALGAVGLPRGSRIVLEKPFGEDLESAVALNRTLAEVGGPAAEDAVFRVDHVLGMATVHNLLGLRTNRVFEQVWSSQHIEQVDILWEETLGLEGRAGYFDRTGTLKDVVQNHMLQLLCLVAMEMPEGLEGEALRDRKVEVLRSIHPVGSRRARYTRGTLPAYVDEPGVDSRRGTETFAEVVLELGQPRWAGTRFRLRAGKALAARRKEIVIRFRGGGPAPDELLVGIDGPERIRLNLRGLTAGRPPEWIPLALEAPAPRSDVPAYARVLEDVLTGGRTLSVRGDEAELAWSALTPVLQAWAEGSVPLEEYPAGSSGPTQ